MRLPESATASVQAEVFSACCDQFRAYHDHRRGRRQVWLKPLEETVPCGYLDDSSPAERELCTLQSTLGPYLKCKDTILCGFSTAEGWRQITQEQKCHPHPGPHAEKVRAKRAMGAVSIVRMKPYVGVYPKALATRLTRRLTVHSHSAGHLFSTQLPSGRLPPHIRNYVGTNAAGTNAVGTNAAGTNAADRACSLQHGSSLLSVFMAFFYFSVIAENRTFRLQLVCTANPGILRVSRISETFALNLAPVRICLVRIQRKKASGNMVACDWTTKPTALSPHDKDLGQLSLTLCFDDWIFLTPNTEL
ncbi:hypothetical protein ACRRTK_023285 [Alexandromys fortis]